MDKLKLKRIDDQGKGREKTNIIYEKKNVNKRLSHSSPFRFTSFIFFFFITLFIIVLSCTVLFYFFKFFYLFYYLALTLARDDVISAELSYFSPEIDFHFTNTLQNFFLFFLCIYNVYTCTP